MNNINPPILGRTTSKDIVSMSDGAMNHNILFLGESGSGKTHAAMTLINNIFKSFDRGEMKGGNMNE